MKKSQMTRQRIAEFFVELMKTKDFDKITVKEVAQGIGIQRSTFYQYFDNCQELLEFLKEDFLAGMHFYEPTPGRMALDLTPVPSVERWFAYCLAHRDLLLAFWSAHGDGDFREQFQEKVCADIQRMMDAEGMPQDKLRPFCVELNYSIHVSLLRFALQTAGTELAMSAKQLAGLANNWRAAAILAEHKQGIPTTEEEFEKLYGKRYQTDILTEK